VALVETSVGVVGHLHPVLAGAGACFLVVTKELVDHSLQLLEGEGQARIATNHSSADFIGAHPDIQTIDKKFVDIKLFSPTAPTTGVGVGYRSQLRDVKYRKENKNFQVINKVANLSC
jgi:hypothetical protein